MAHFLLSRKKKRMLMFNGNYYTLNKTVDNDEYWQCADQNCPGTAIKRGLDIIEGQTHPRGCQRLV
jgi:hypothetical protein